ncbi:MAG: response regulator transcription factor [Deltaproteobacteria bacterium]|nr:response regulator transcription factor [Deltaproteobacteria bacterium]
MRILLVDDHTIVRQGLLALLGTAPGLAVVGEAGSAAEAIALAGELLPDVAVMDLSLPDRPGPEAIAGVRAASPDTEVLVLSMHDGEDYVRPALRAGARGYLVKGSGLHDLVAAIHAVALGHTFFSPAVSALLVHDAAADNSSPQARLRLLSAREQEVLRWVVLGRTSSEIGDLLGIAAKTVEAHRANLGAKLHLHDVPALVRFAIRAGLISADA